MVLSDQQLRQELINYGEIVPPITQRNREQLRARLETLRTQKTKQAASSPSRTRAAASPSRAAASSPSRSRTTASPSRAASSPSRSRTTASPSRLSATSSPSRTRATRSKQTPNLIELSDSDTESASKGVLMSRSVRTGQTAPHAQTRSIAVRSQQDSSTSPSKRMGSPGKMTNDVEESIARHRREIKQLLDSARDRTTRGTHSGEPSSSSPSRIRRESSKSDDEGRKKSSSSSPKRAGKAVQTGWKKILHLIKNLLKILLIGSIFLGGGLFLWQYSNDVLPRERIIHCSVKNATECEDMKPVIAAVRKQLQIRTGEVDCGFRALPDVRVPRAEIERYLNEKGLKFNLGNDERWKTLLTYIINKPIKDIIIWNNQDQPINTTVGASKLSTKDAIRSLTCRARQDINHTLRNLLLLILGSTGLLGLAWLLRRHSKDHEENERTFKDYLRRATKLIEEQYEKHVRNPQAQPWLAINHIRDKLIPEEDRERLKHIWERVKNEISKQDSRIRSELQEIDGKSADVWRWIKSTATSISPKKTRSQTAKNTTEDTDDYPSSEVGLTECLKLRNCFRSDNYADDDEIDDVVDSIQERCANIKRIEHIGIHSVFVYLKFSSKEAAGQGYHLLNNWKYQDREVSVKYVRLNRYYEHFPEAHDASNDN